MIRFLLLCILVFLLYIAFGAIEEYDYSLKISLLDYQIETTIFTFAAVFILIQLFLLIVLKLVFLIFNLPMIIKNSWNQRNIRNTNKKLLRIYSELLMGNRDKSLKMTHQIVYYLNDENKEFVNLVLAETEEGFDKKIHYLRELIDKKNYSVYAAKKLANLFYNNSMYMQAEEHAVRAFNEDDTDIEAILVLIKVYSKLKLWPKMIFIVSKLQRADRKFLVQNSQLIASYYFDAAKDSLENNNDEEAIKYLESALELNPDYIEALNLFMELNINLNNTSSILKILKAAFASKPCFEIAEMYVKCSCSSVDAIYGTLAGLAKPSENVAVFLAIAAYLGLEDKIREIKSPKLISYEGN